MSDAIISTYGIPYSKWCDRSYLLHQNELLWHPTLCRCNNKHLLHQILNVDATTITCCIGFVFDASGRDAIRSKFSSDSPRSRCASVCVIWEWWLDSSFIDFALSISLFLWNKVSVFLASGFVSHLYLTLRERFYTIEHMEHLYLWDGMGCFVLPV